MNYEQAANLLASKNNIALLCHIRPDADTVGSACALKSALESMGKNVTVFCADKMPKRLAFIPEADFTEYSGETTAVPDICLAEKGIIFSAPDENFLCRLKTALGSPDILLCAVDVAETHLLGAVGEATDGRIDLKIDHHRLGSPYAAENLIVPEAAATGEIIFDILKAMPGLGSFGENVSSALYAAISSDTGCFRYSNVTPKTLKTAAALIESGAHSYAVSQRLFELKTKEQLSAENALTGLIRYSAGGAIASVTVSNEMKRNLGIDDEDISDLVSLLRQIEGVRLAVTIKQTAEEKVYKVSMRSLSEVDASAICAVFGGGGHRRAAGATVEADSPEEAESKVLETAIGFFPVNGRKPQ